MRWTTLLVCTLVACGGSGSKEDDHEGNDGGDDGGSDGGEADEVELSDVFPLDGERTWRYASDDYTWGWETRLADREIVEAGTRATLVHSQDDTEEVLMEEDWLSDADGLYLTGVRAGGLNLSFDPHLDLAANTLSEPGESWTSVSGEYSLTATFNGIVACETLWTDVDWDCVHLTVSSTADNPVRGEWYLAPSWGRARFALTDGAAPWVLTQAEWAPED